MVQPFNVNQITIEGNLTVYDDGVGNYGLLTSRTLNAVTLNGTGSVPTVANGAQNVGGSVTVITGHDMGGRFILTGGTASSIGTAATVTFGTALAAAPASVVVSGVDTGGNGTATTFGAGAFATTGFTVYGPVLTSTHSYLVSYEVVAS